MERKPILLKLSGEALNGPEKKFPYDPETMLVIAKEVAEAHRQGVRIAIVIGGGNIFRGAQGASHGMNRAAADQFGMLATVQNGIALRDMLIRKCEVVDIRLMSAVIMPEVAEHYIVQRATHHLEKDRIIILAGGTGHGYCTTDYAAAVRACEIGAKFVAKATNIDGVYDRDPRKHPKEAKLLRQVTYDRCIDDRLEVMDTEAFALCRTEKIPIRVFSLSKPGNIVSALTGGGIGSLVST